MEKNNKNTSEEEAYRAEVRHNYANTSTTKTKKFFHRLQEFIWLIIVFIIVISGSVFSIFNFGGNTSANKLPEVTELEKLTGEDKVSLDNLTKEFYESSIYPQIIFNLTFANNTDKDIKGFESLVTFSDIFDNEIEAIKFTYDEGLKSHYEVKIEKAIDYNQFMDNRVKLKNTELKNITYKWEVATIVYEDGTKETF